MQVYRQIDFQRAHITLALVFPNIYLTPVNSWPATDSMSKHTQPFHSQRDVPCQCLHRIPLAWKPVFSVTVVSIWICSSSHHSLLRLCHLNPVVEKLCISTVYFRIIWSRPPWLNWKDSLPSRQSPFCPLICTRMYFVVSSFFVLSWKATTRTRT